MIDDLTRDDERRKTQFNILLIEDNATDALLIQSYLEKSANFIMQATETLLQALECLNSRDFDVILLDLNLPDAVGLEGLIKLRYHMPKIPIVVLTGVNDRDLGIMALQRGAQDYLIKGVDSNRVMESIRYAIERVQVTTSENLTVSQNSLGINKYQIHSRTISGAESDIRGKQLLLTERELQVLKLLGKGCNNQEIADRLIISLATVKTHMGSIMQKLSVSDRTNAVIEAQNHGLI